MFMPCGVFMTLTDFTFGAMGEIKSCSNAGNKMGECDTFSQTRYEIVGKAIGSIIKVSLASAFRLGSIILTLT